MRCRARAGDRGPPDGAVARRQRDRSHTGSAGQYQDRYRCYGFVADVHALTTPDASEQPLARRALGVARAYLAAGLDPSRTALYRRSAIASEVCELATYLAMLTPLGEVLRCPTFKEKARRHPDHVSLGLASHPVLMAADVLLLKASLVPVGRDQLPHLERARSVGRTFNRRFGPLFVEPTRWRTTRYWCPR